MSDKPLTISILAFLAWLVACAVTGADTRNEEEPSAVMTTEEAEAAAIRGAEYLYEYKGPDLYMLGGLDDSGRAAAIRVDSHGRVYCSPEELPDGQ